jgi:hypothetical protein
MRLRRLPIFGGRKLNGGSGGAGTSGGAGGAECGSRLRRLPIFGVRKLNGGSGGAGSAGGAGGAECGSRLRRLPLHLMAEARQKTQCSGRHRSPAAHYHARRSRSPRVTASAVSLPLHKSTMPAVPVVPARQAEAEQRKLNSGSGGAGSAGGAGGAECGSRLRRLPHHLAAAALRKTQCSGRHRSPAAHDHARRSRSPRLTASAVPLPLYKSKTPAVPVVLASPLPLLRLVRAVFHQFRHFHS